MKFTLPKFYEQALRSEAKRQGTTPRQILTQLIGQRIGVGGKRR
jgi:hypothetical protein